MQQTIIGTNANLLSIKPLSINGNLNQSTMILVHENAIKCFHNVQ